MAETTTDHDTIRAWAESHGGRPAAVERSHDEDDEGIVRITFPDANQFEHQALVEISRDEFFEQFEDSGLAPLFDPKSRFNKIVGRDTAERREQGEAHASRHRR